MDIGSRDSLHLTLTPVTMFRIKHVELLFLSTCPVGIENCSPNCQCKSSNPQVLHRNMLVEMDHPTAGRIKQTGVQIKLSETPGALEYPPPLLSQHTEEILSHLGYSPESIKILKESDII
ncbi:MAG: CoA transferase [Theionarchaea archaeon]|nr:CoA transferase [Theionarchaea archaeon]